MEKRRKEEDMAKRIIIFCFIFLLASSGILAQPIPFAPEDPVLEKEVAEKRGEEGEQLLDTAWRLYGEREYDKAIKYCKKALVNNPDDYGANAILGANYAKKGDFKKAVTYYQKATNVYPKEMVLISMTAFFNPGEENYRKNFYKAIEEYKNEITKNPNNYQAYNDLGYLSFVLRVAPEFAEYYKKSIEIKPDYAQAHYNLAFYYLFNEDKKLALEECKILEKLNKDFARVIQRTIELDERNKEEK